MKTIMIDGSKYSSSSTLHQALKMMLELPDYYGGNADALHDCLAERKDAVNVWVLSLGIGETKQALIKCLHVIEDSGGNIVDIS